MHAVSRTIATPFLEIEMRCKLCDNVMKATEIVWKPEKSEHEPWCGSCRKAAVNDDLDFDSESTTFTYGYHRFEELLEGVDDD